METTTNRRGFLAATGATTLGTATLGFKSLLSAQEQPGNATRELDELIDYDAMGLAELIKKKEVTPAELVEIFIRRIDTINPIINCMATPTFEQARAKAKTIPANTVFAGVPSLIKDMVDIGGVRRTDGSRLLATNIPKASVAWVEAFDRAGLNLLGTTTAPEFAAGFESQLFGKTHNPWNLKYTCVCSSMGAAAAVASGIAPLVHGTDGGGSNRMPPSACGVFGFKPSRGRLFSGEKDGSHDLFKTNCGISRTVRDNVALFTQTVDKEAQGFERFENVTGPSKRRLRIAFAPNGVQNMKPTVDSVKQAVVETAKLLDELGHQVELIKHPVNGAEFFSNYRYAYLPKFAPVLKQVEAISGRSAAQSGLLSPWTASMLEVGRNFTAEQIERGQQYFKNISKLYGSVFERFDVLLTPVMPVETPTIGTIKPTDSFEKFGSVLEHTMSMTAPINPIGDCAMSVPLSTSQTTGMPIGSMFHAPSGQDKMLYELAFELEAAKPWKDRWAPISIKYIPT